MRVTILDWSIVAAFFIFFLGVAIYLSRRCTSVADYLVSGRKVRMWLGIGAGIAGEIGLVSVAAMAQQGYLRGYSFTLLQILSVLLMTPLFGIFGFGIERFRATGCVTVPEFIEMRYSRRLRILTGMSNCLAGVLQMCIFPIVGAMFLKTLILAPDTVQLAGFVMRTELLIMAILLACNILFTYFGGYVTLTVTNFLMMILIMGAIAWLLFYLVTTVGLQTYWTSLESKLGLAGFYPFTGEAGSYSVIWFAWGLVMMPILLQFSYGPYLQKYASMDKPKTVSRSFLLGSIFGSGRVFLVMGFGVATLAVLGTAPPAEFAGDKEQWSQMATAYYLARVIPPVLMGFWLACLLFADISTTDQYILSWSTSIVNDCIQPFRKRPLETHAHIRAVRITIFVLAVLFLFAGLAYKPTIPIWEFLWLLANIIAGSGIAVLFGMYWRRANTYGAYAAILFNIIAPLTDLGLRYLYAVKGWKDYPLLPEHTGFGSYAIGILLLVVVSLLTPDEGKFLDLGKKVRDLNARTDDQTASEVPA